MSGLPWIRDDGGRVSAGFTGTADDCVCRAIAIAAEIPYREVYDALNGVGKAERTRKNSAGQARPKSSARTGVYGPTCRRFMESLGWAWHPTMRIGQGCKVHLAPRELPDGRLIVQVSKHIVAVVDGVVHDVFDPSRDGTRCVYGYWMKGPA